jgi:AcrR family transcriptional regulator
VESFAKAPKQERSRRSFDKAVDAAVALVVERRSDAFTLAEVAERAGVSTGSIYGRVKSKTDLLRTAHARQMERIEAETTRVFGAPAPISEDLHEAVSRVVQTVGNLLRANAPVLGAFMYVANNDSVIAEVGRKSHHQLVDAYRAALLAHRSEINAEDIDQAVDWSLTVVYSVLARWLGLGSDPASAAEGDWDQILENLAETVTAFLVRGSSRFDSTRDRVHAGHAN